jgi:uncharacterized protein YndB with AHSA1/START domain
VPHADAKHDDRLDLVLTRDVKLPRELIWRAWTEPKHLVKWFTPAPWKTVDCEIDLRPGGIFRTVMQGPDGQKFDNAGCYLDVVKHQRLVFTDALGPGYRPAASSFMTAIMTFEEHNGGTRYIARALHKDDADRKKHEEMGFHDGWATALDQLIALGDQLRD